MGGVGSYAPQRAQAGEGVAFAVNIIFSGGQTERITFGTGTAVTTLEAKTSPEDLGALPDTLSDLDPQSPELARLAVAFGTRNG